MKIQLIKEKGEETTTQEEWVCVGRRMWAFNFGLNFHNKITKNNRWKLNEIMNKTRRKDKTKVEKRIKKPTTAKAKLIETTLNR